MGKIPVKKIEEILNALDAQKGLYIEDCSTGEKYIFNADYVFPSCSLIKIPIFAMLLEEAAAGNIDLDNPQCLSAASRFPGSGVLWQLDHGIEISLRDLATLMIVLSDNSAANEITLTLGIERLNAYFKKNGYNSFLFDRLQGDYAPLLEGHDNRMNTGDIGRMLSSIARRKYASPEICDEIIRIMSMQKFRDKLGALIPAIPDYAIIDTIPQGQVLMANKTGSRVGLQHDAGIFILPDSRKYVIAMMTAGLKNDRDGSQAIAKVSKAVYEAFC